MSLLQQLYNLYFDTVRLAEELERFPVSCHFWQTGNGCGEAGICNFLISGEKFARGRTCAESLARVGAVRCDLVLLQQEILIQIGTLSPEERSEGLEPQLFALQNVLTSLDPLLQEMGFFLASLPCACTAGNLENLKNHNASLKVYLQELESVL